MKSWLVPWSLIVWLTTFNHFAWGIELLIDNRASWVTSIATSHLYLCPSHIGKGVILILVSLFAAYGIRTKRRFLGLVSALPQQFLLFLSAFGACRSVWFAAFADGVERPRIFILADQQIHILIAFAHMIGILLLHKSKTASHG